jgi:hypothetical protein
VAVRVEPCDWPLDTTCCDKWADADPAKQQFAQKVATELIWRLSGRRFGLCPITVRPCRTSCDQPELPAWPPPAGQTSWPVLTGGGWINAACGPCARRRRDCSCVELQEITLPGPVHEITEVRVDGQVLDAAAYAVHDHRLLVRTDGEVWPDCQDLTAAPDQPGAFTVTYLQGVEVPPGGRYAAGVYACELLKACTGGQCRLPRRVQSLTREGVTLTFLDPMDFLDKGRTGIPEVDQWLAAVNPTGQRAPSQVYSPDLPPPRTVTWTAPP